MGVHLFIYCRSSLIQEATNKNQAFESAVQSLDFFLINLPNHKIKPTDGVAQINSKQNSQKVSTSISLLIIPTSVPDVHDHIKLPY